MTQMEYWLSITWLSEDSDHSSDKTVSPEDVARWEQLIAEGQRCFIDENPYLAERYRAYHAGELTMVQVNMPKGADLEGAVFKDAFFANRAYSPSLGAVLADLVRRGELPRGKYIYKHWW